MSEFDLVAPGTKGTAGRTLSDAVYQRIYERISNGEWPKGTRLLTEIELAEQFGVSRTVIREALLRLRIDGLIASRQGAGTHVIGAPSQRVIDFAEPGSVADLQRCYEFRVGVEGEAAYLAATRHSSERIAEIEATLDAMERCIAEDRLGAEEDIAFHLAIARATENDYYQRTIASATKAIRVGMSIAATLSSRPPPQRLGIAIGEHRGVLDAIRASDPDLARARMRAHIEGARRRVFVGTS
jgi:GntR family transcriptional regulator, transcriptional repressor for pyruvate dehydrogenase complex